MGKTADRVVHVCVDCGSTEQPAVYQGCKRCGGRLGKAINFDALLRDRDRLRAFVVEVSESRDPDIAAAATALLKELNIVP